MDAPVAPRAKADSRPAGDNAPQRKVAWGIIGCGWVARDFAIPAIHDAARLAAVCDPNPARTDGLGAPARTLDALLADDAVEAVYIATPNHLHRAAVEAAAAAGKAILCEKPLAATLFDAEAMVAAVLDAAVPFATAFDQRFHGAHRMIRDWIAAGRLGRITQARIHYACWLPADFAPIAGHDNWRIDSARAGGGAVIDLAPHGIDLITSLTGAAPLQMHAMLQRAVQPYPVDDGGILTVRYEGDLLASIAVAYNCPDTLPRRRLEITGTEGAVIAENTMGQTAGGSLAFVDAAGTRREVPIVNDRPPFAVQIEAFSAHVRGAPFPGSAQADLAAHRLLVDALGRAT